MRGEPFHTLERDSAVRFESGPNLVHQFLRTLESENPIHLMTRGIQEQQCGKALDSESTGKSIPLRFRILKHPNKNIIL